jgi:thiosulfate/3-mercaptopyruvate sulfurtransferase
VAQQLLITSQELAAHLDDPNWLVVDCRFTLSKPDEKHGFYLQAHIPGAIYAHLDHDLASPIIPGLTGRHPLPTPEETARRFRNMGIGPGVQVVAYDDAGGALAAVRLWWMLRWLGHMDVAILDGGWQKWLEADYPVRGGDERRPLRQFSANPHPEMVITSADVERLRLDPAYRLIDVRAPDRYSGQFEPIDPVAGHIPGAYNLSYLENLNSEGVLRSPQELRVHYQALIDNTPAERVVFYCGSGVTSIHSLLAMMHAGLGEGRVYIGSWSEWIAPRTRPVATGEARGE